MKIKTVISLLVPVLGLFLSAACSQERDAVGSSQGQLELTVAIDQPAETRTATPLTATYFATGTQLGITVQKTDGTAYPSHEHTNVLFSAKSSGSNQTWGSTGVDLTTEAARVSAYYPFDFGYNPSAIPITCDEQTDWMYCPWTDKAANNGTINADNRAVRLTMKHAQTIIKYQLVNVNYTNEGNIYRLDIKGKFGRKGTLNSYTGALSDVDEKSFISEQYGTALNFMTDGATNQWFVLPTPDAGEQDVDFTFYIDDKEYRTTVSANLEQGKIYTFNLKMNDTFLSVASVECEAWTEGLSKTTAVTPYTPATPYQGVLMYSDDTYDYYWAEYNVGGSLTEPYGDFFRLGDTKPYESGNASIDLTGLTTICGTEYDAAIVIMGDEWQMPTGDDWLNLESHSTVTAELGVGYRVTSKTTSNSIMIHFAGFYSNGGRDGVGYQAVYWSGDGIHLYNNKVYGGITEFFYLNENTDNFSFFQPSGGPATAPHSIRAIRKVMR